MTRKQRWHSLQGAKVDKIPLAFSGGALPGAFPLFGTRSGSRRRAHRVAPFLFSSWHRIPACFYIFAFGLYDLAPALKCKSHSRETKEHHHAQEILTAVREEISSDHGLGLRQT